MIKVYKLRAEIVQFETILDIGHLIKDGPKPHEDFKNLGIKKIFMAKK